MRLFATAFVLCLGFVAGCANLEVPTTRVNIDSLAQPDAAAKKHYVLFPGGKGVESGDLQFQEFAAYTEKVLAERGFVKADKLQDADIAIFLTFAVGDPQTYQYSYAVPTWGQTGVLSSNTFGTASSYGGMATYSGTTTYTPRYGITGYTSQIGTRTVYTRFLSLDAYDVAAYAREKKMNQVWKTSVVSTGSSGDLRQVFPYMASAMKPYVGTNTGRRVEVIVPATDPYVEQLRGGAAAPSN